MTERTEMGPFSSQTRLLLQVCLPVAVLACVGVVWVMFRRSPANVPEATVPVVEAPRQNVRLDKPQPPAQDFVGSQACAECHKEICKSYGTHAMSRSTAGVMDAAIIEDTGQTSGFTVPPNASRKGSLHYFVDRTDQRVLHHETWIDEDGEVVYDQAVRVHYAIGSGKRVRSYVIDRGGLLFLSPVAWYSEKKQWDFWPDDAKRNTRFERRVVDGCLSCHVGRVSADRDTPNRFHSPPFVEAGIGCERCHGPGKNHIVRHQSDTASADPDPIVNPPDLDPRRREAICNQCHLHGIERVLRYGRIEYDFRPGENLSDIWTIFIRGTGAASNDVADSVSQVEQMRTSACYRRSNGKFGCCSCHDPHASPPPTERTVFYQEKCLACHGQAVSPCALPSEQRLAGSPKDSCIDCHMPRLTPAHVLHTSQTDHRVRRVPADIVPRTQQEVPLAFFDEADSRIPKLDVRRARGIVMLRFAEEEQNAFLASRAVVLLEASLDAADDDIPVLEALGAAYWLQGRPYEAKRLWKRALRLDPDHESVLERLALLCHETEEYQAGVGYLDRLFAVNRWRSDLYGRQTHMLGKLENFQRGIESARRGIELNPSLSRLHGWLVDAYEMTGQPDLSRRHRRQYQKLSPKR